MTDRVFDVPWSIREPGPGVCLYCHHPVERYRTAGNQYDPGSPLLAAFQPARVGAWRLDQLGTMHRRNGTTQGSGQAYEVHLCAEAQR